ncbi:MAG: hypothetical protein LAQ30_04050 [Acidobacteriia bacterium]|nr:hypothetical protein [Terriglobia bacterium]
MDVRACIVVESQLRSAHSKTREHQCGAQVRFLVDWVPGNNVVLAKLQLLRWLRLIAAPIAILSILSAAAIVAGVKFGVQ